MNLNKQFSDYKSKGANINCPVIKISHYEDDKLLKTETYPVGHFLNLGEGNIKKVKYN